MSSSKQDFLFEIIRLDPNIVCHFPLDCISLFTHVSNAQLNSRTSVSFNPPSLISFSKNDLANILPSHKKFENIWSILLMIFLSGFGKTVKRYTSLGSASVLITVTLPIINKWNLLYKLNNFSMSKILD